MSYSGLLSVVYYLNVSFSRLITTFREEKAVFFCNQLLVFLLFLLEGIPLPQGAWDRLHYFIVALPGPSI